LTKVYNRYANLTFLRGQTVAVEQGSYQHRLLGDFGGINIKTFPDKVAPLRALYNDEVSAYCGPVQTAYYLIGKLNYTGITTLGTPLGLTEMRFAVNRDRGDVLNMLNDGFEDVVQSGEYDRLYRKWFVTDLSDAEQEAMIKAANEAVLAAYAPYGRQGRGAAVLTATGRIYSACTVENADERLNLSAVVAAVGQAVAAGELELRGAVCVDAGGAVITPGPEECQFLHEFGRGVLALVEKEPGRRQTFMMSDMLDSPVVGRAGQINIQ
jgi:cytidine deaminase